MAGIWYITVYGKRWHLAELCTIIRCEHAKDVVKIESGVTRTQSEL